MAFSIPNHDDLLTLTDDWQVVLEWRDRNLRMLKAFKLTGMVKDPYYNQNKTVPNKLFLGDDGEYTPVQVTFSKGTMFTLSRYIYGYSGIYLVDLKCAGGGEKKGIKGLCLQLPLAEFEKMEASITRAPEED